MILYFLRHGRAEERQPGGRDEDRPLSEEGVAQLRAAAPAWRRLNLRPDVILSSPLPRAAQTAELLADALRTRDPETADRLAPGAEWSDFGRCLADHPDARRIVFVGHEPDLSRTVTLLTGATVRLRPGGLAAIEFPGVPEPGAGELAWLLDPDLYARDET
ncbi:MAG TPA: histidine phosphatase family protein [Candidatus Limnocylindria bacterium]|nr:histidine phosphatase family protein [Candidatus Limnocylindria bacterium]